MKNILFCLLKYIAYGYIVKTVKQENGNNNRVNMMNEASVDIPSYWMTDLEKVNSYLETKVRKGSFSRLCKSSRTGYTR